jgi:hypothetical protein
VCIEVVEHMPKADSEAAVANFCRHSDDVLFSSSPLDYKEATHLNVQPPEYWAGLFARNGFVRDVDFDASFLTPWAVRFRRQRDAWPRIIQRYERRLWLREHEVSELRASCLELHQLLAERESDQADIEELRDLVEAYERGRFIRLMKWLRNRAWPGRKVRQ